MDAAVRKAIARIDVIQDGKTLSRGTGSLVSDRLVLSALHVVSNRQASPPTPYRGTIRLTFPGHTTEAVFHQGGSDAQSDWVLLECAEPPRVRPIPLGELNESGGGFETFGFPEIQPIDGIVQRGTVENHDAELLGTKVLQLFSHQAAAADGAPVNGSSGSPVLVDNALVGVLRAALMSPQGLTRAGTLYACPLGAVLDRCGDLLPAPDPCRGLPGLRRRPLPAQPFTYLNRFTAAEAEIFFGRNRDIRHLYKLLTGEDTAPVVLLYGQAGVGKSSFLEAAVRPRLEWTHEVRYLRSERHERLLQTLLRTMEADAGSTASGLEARWRRLEESSGRPLVVILDQIEEIYVQDESNSEGLAELVAALAALFASGLTHPQSRVVLSFRKEWFPEILKAVEQAALSYGKVFLDRLDRESVVEVVSGLTSTRRLRDHYGLSVDERLPAVIADDLQEDRDSPIAPTLRILLSKMWEQATSLSRSAPVFSVESYQRLRRQGILLGDFLDQQISGLGNERATDVASGLAIDVLAFHTSPLLTAQQRQAAELEARYRHRARELPALIQAMKRQWLLVNPAGDSAADARATRLSHDTLAPLVRQRFDESDRPGQRARRILEARTDWRGDRDGTALDQADLDVVERGLESMRSLEASEERLLKASRDRRAMEQWRRRLWRVAGAAAVLLIVVSAVISWLSANRAERERRRVVSAARTVLARAALESDPALAAQILAELRRYPEPPDGGSTAFLVLNQPIPVAILRRHTDPIRTVSVSPDGQSLVTTSDDQTALIWRLDNPTDPVELDHRVKIGGSLLPDDRNFVLGGVYDSRGASIATFSRDDRARLWNREGKLLFTLKHDDTVDGASFNKAGTLLLTTTARDSTSRIWDVGTGALIHSLRHPAPVVSAEFGSRSNPQQILTLAGGQLRVWTLANNDPLERVVSAPANTPISAAAFSADGTSIAAGGRDGRVWLLPAGTTGPPNPMPNPPNESGPVRTITSSPAGLHFAITWNDLVRVWYPVDGLSHTLAHPDDTIRQMAFSDDGAFMAMAAGNYVWLWPGRPSAVRPLTELRGHSARIESIDFTRDGRFVVTGSSDCTARVWHTGVTEPTQITRVPPTSKVSLDARGVYAAVRDAGRISLWRIADGEANELSSASIADDDIREVQIDATGSHLLAITSNGQMRVWRAVPGSATLESIVERDHVSTAAFGADGSSLDVVDARGAIWEWRIGGSWPVSPRATLDREFEKAAWAPNATQLLTAIGNRAIVSGREGRPLADLVSSSPITAMALNRTGARAIAGTRTGAYVWDLSNVPRNNRPSATPLPQIGDTASWTSFSRDGSKVLILDVRGAARVFSSDGTGSPIELTAENLQTVSFDEDGSHVLGVTTDGRILRWRIGWDALIEALANATSCLTPEQRVQLFGEQLEEARATSRTCEAGRRSRLTAQANPE